MDGDERRSGKKQSLETSKEMLAKYKAELTAEAQDADTGQAGDPSDEELLHNDTTGQSIEPPGTSMTEGISSRDITQSSMSVSEGEGEGDLEGMAGRVAELEEMLQGKEAVVEALSAEIDHLRAEASSPNSSQSHNSGSHQYRDVVLLYHTKLQDFERAVNQRDNLIHDLTASLEQALSARDTLKAQLQSMSAGETIPPDMGNCSSSQDHVASLECQLIEHKTMISKLSADVMKFHENVKKLETEKEAQSAEINDYKTRINQLNEQIRVGAVENTLNIAETMEMQKQYEARVEKIKKDMQIILEKFAAETKSKTSQHEEAMRELETKYQRELTAMKVKYDEQYRDMADRYNQELPDLERKHAKELSVFQSQLSSYKKTVESLKLELVNRTESQQTLIAELQSLRERLGENKRDREMLNEQINLHKVQLDDLTSKYVAAASILDSKESIERSLEEALTNVACLEQENRSLKFKYDDLSARYSASQSLLENNQAHERSLSNRIFDLEKSLSRLSGASFSSELNETTYRPFDDIAVHYQATRQKLDERAELERQLFEKIRILEEEVTRAKDELNRTNLEKESYEKQLKDMKNSCDKLRYERDSRKNYENSDDTEQPFRDSVYYVDCDKLSRKSVKTENLTDNAASLRDIVAKLEAAEHEISLLKETIDLKDRDCAETREKFVNILEKLRSTEAECEHLKNGMAIAWEQCAEFEEKLNKTLAISDETRLTDSLAISRFETTDEERSRNGSRTSNNDTFKTARQFSTTEKNIQTEENNEFNESCVMIREFESLKRDNENLSRELNDLRIKLANFDETTRELEKFETDNNELRLRDDKFSRDEDKIVSLGKCIDELTAEKIALGRELSNLVEKHREELAAVRRDAIAEVEKIRNLMLSAGQDENGIEKLKNELDTRHAREMEELRTYFEEKCLQMEKQYSDEIFSQQSKKMSENDSEIEDLAEDLYYVGGGGGDCTSVNRNKNDNSGNDTNLVDAETKIYNNESSAIVDSGLVTAVNQLCQTEWDSALENGELTKLRAAYSNQLEEQVALAKLDIVNALQEQIQALLAVESDMEDNWPSELLELRNKFTNSAKRETEELRLIHEGELKQLRDENSRSLARIIERHEEELRKIMDERQSEKGKSEYLHSNVDNNELIRERDNLYKACVTLKELIVDLTKYFAVCEEELNNTLISEVLKRQVSSIDAETSLKKDSQHDTTRRDEKIADPCVEPKSSETKIKRVHFAPQCSQIVSIINGDTNNLESENDAGCKLRRELDVCLRRMKSESAEVLGINPMDGESMLDMLSKQILRTTRINEELGEKLTEAENLVIAHREESRILNAKMMNLQQSLLAVEGKKEIVTEGYGEHDETGGELIIQDFSQLQEKARHAIISGIGDNAYLLQLIEELCRYNDKMSDEMRKEKEDLQQQIEAADKQLRGTRKFLEEQASEREIERDDAARQISALQEQIKEREREKERDLRITSESSLSPVSSAVARVLEATDVNAAVEALESQMREMSSLMSDTEAKKAETESELKVAVDKIWVLRDIIVDLEQQIQARIEKEETLIGQIEQLEEVIAAQTKNQHELAQELDAIKMGGENSQLNEHIAHLEEELRKHKLSSEHFNVNSSALKQMRIEMRDMEIQLDKRTRELESLHMCGSNLSLSQPSEDVSIREQIDVTRCPTPDDPNSPPTLPLDRLLKLKEKMLKHARAEEVAFKRIKDLDMQLSTYKIQNEELQAEQEILQQTASEQLFQMEAMRGRLEQQKQSAPFAQRQATSRLELQLHEAYGKLNSLERTIGDRELEMNETKEQLKRANQLLQEKQKEFMNVMQTENNAIQELRDRLNALEEEKKLLKSKLGVQERAQVELPQLLDSMLADKNDEIDHLKEQLSKRDGQLRAYLTAAMSINENNNEGSKQHEARNSARTLSDILSINSECEDFSEAIREVTNLSRALPHEISKFGIQTTPIVAKDTLYDGSPAVLLDVEKPEVDVPRLELGSSASASISSACPRNSRLSLDLMQNTDLELESPSCLDTMESSSPSVNKIEKSNGHAELGRESANNENLRKIDESTCPGGSRDNEASSSRESSKTFGDLGKDSRIRHFEAQLRATELELRAKTSCLEKRENELVTLERDIEDLRRELREKTDALSREKDFHANRCELARATELRIRRELEETENKLTITSRELEEHKNMLLESEKIIAQLRTSNDDFEESSARREAEILKNHENELAKASAELESSGRRIDELIVKLENAQERSDELANENKRLVGCEELYEMAKKELEARKPEIKRSSIVEPNVSDEIRRETNESSAIDGESSKDREIHHLQEYLREKENVIRQMSDDSRSLHRALETIQCKMKESGNVVELRKKLKDERAASSELRETMKKLCRELEIRRSGSKFRADDENAADIEDMVQRELDLSARLDQRIMSVIESETEEETPSAVSSRRIEKHSCNSLVIEPADDDRAEILTRKYDEMRRRLRQALKTNRELTKLRDDREIEREMLAAQIAEYETRIFQLNGDIDEKSMKLKRLDEELESARSDARSLEIQLRREKISSETSRSHDSQLISQLRLKLANSLDGEESARRDLTKLRREHENLEARLNVGRDLVDSQNADETNVFAELLAREQERYAKIAETLDREVRDNDELRDSLKRLEADKYRCEKELESANEEYEKLSSSLALAVGVREHLEIDARRTKEELKSREEERDWLQKRIKTLEDAQSKRQRRSSDEENELRSLRRGMSNAREVIHDLEADLEQSKSQLVKANEELARSARLLEVATIGENELRRKLEIARAEENRLRETIDELRRDLRLGVKREIELTDELQKERFSGEKNVPAKFVQRIKELNEMMEKNSHDNGVLHEKLAKARQEREQFAGRARDLESQLAQKIREASMAAGTADLNPQMTEKLQHFYGKYLRVDSRRKALVYQKRYLLCIVGGYQLSEDRTITMLAQLTHEQRLYTTTSSNEKSPRVRFRCAVLVIISIHRMKWMLQRWRTGRRVGANAVLGNHEQSFLPLRRAASNHSPPVRDRTTAGSGFSLERYIDRFMDIQQRLGMAIPDMET